MSFLLKTDKQFIKGKTYGIIAHFIMLLLCYTTYRIGFFAFNTFSFSEVKFTDFLYLAFKGFRYDIAAISMINLLFFFLYALPVNTYKVKWYNTLLKIIFVIPNLLMMMFEVADWMYFPFNQRRANAEVLDMVSRKADFINILPAFVRDYWYLFVIAFVFVLLFIKIVNRLNKRINERFFKTAESVSYKYYLVQAVNTLAVVALGVLGIRGGFQLIPISIRDAITVTTNEKTPLVLNTTFSIITTYGNKKMDRLNLVPYEEAQKVVQTTKQYTGDEPFIKKNIVIIGMESFSKEFTKLTNGDKSYTPFLDSIMNHCLVFDNAYSNAVQSAYGVPALLASIPGLLDKSFSTSAFANNKINSFASLLKPYGYHTSFFHGASNGSMSFDIFSKNAGYDMYFGRTEYNNEKDYDGTWGIWDEPFLQKVADEMNAIPQPFHSFIFNINSHSPYDIPKQYQERFKEEGLPVYASIRYADFAFEQFFKKIATMPWFQNTIFIFSSDHASGMASNDFYQNKVGKFQIPIMIFDPSGTLVKPGYNYDLTQQLDMLPTIMNLLHFPDPYFAFGKDVFAQPSYVLTRAGQEMTFIQDSLRILVANNKLQGAYQFPADSMNTQNLLQNPNYNKAVEDIFFQWKCYMQVYNNDMLDNKLYVPAK